MQKECYAQLYGIFGTNVTNYTLSKATAKIKTKNADYYKKALFQYLKSNKNSLSSINPCFEKH